MRRFVVTIVFFFAFIAPLSVFAAPPPSCNIQYASPFINFGNYDTSSPLPTDVTSSLRVQCNFSGEITITLGASPTSGSFNPRQMSYTPFLLDYNLYRDAGMSEIWGDGFGGTYTVTYSYTDGQGWVNFPVYGRIPALQNVGVSPPNGYRDTGVVATVTWVFGGGGSDTDSVAMWAEVVGVCLISGPAGDMNFGLYDTLEPLNNDAGTSSFSFTCITGTVWQLYISPALRQMTDGVNLLNYELYTDGARLNIWPSSVPSTETGTAPSTFPITKDIFGRIPALQNVPVGGYSGTATVTLVF